MSRLSGPRTLFLKDYKLLPLFCFWTLAMEPKLDSSNQDWVTPCLQISRDSRRPSSSHPFKIIESTYSSQANNRQTKKAYLVYRGIRKRSSHRMGPRATHIPEDRRSLQHFGHERGDAFQLTVTSPNSSQDAIQNGYLCWLAWHKTPDLGHEYNHPSLTNVCGFTAHVGTYKMNYIKKQDFWFLSLTRH